MSLGPTVRVTPMPAAVATVALACLPAVVAVVAGTTNLDAVVVLAFVAGGAVLGWAGDDPAADLLAATPVPAPARTTVRALAVAAVAAVGLAAVTTAVVAGGGTAVADLVARLPEAAAAGAIALAVALVAASRGDRAAGAAGVTAGLFGPATVAALAVRWPATLPGFAFGPGHARWWLVAATAAVVVARAGRDPGRR